MKARNPYSTGCKLFLVHIDVGVEVEVPQELKYYSVKSVATRIYNDFGCRFTFRQKEGKKYVKRLS
jgi:hypothetical protein